jgi:hypothetical protein
LVGKSQVFAEVNIISQKSLHFPSQKMCSFISVLDNFSISKNNLICAEATQGTMVSKLSVNVKPLHTYTTQFIKLALSSVIF